MRKFCQHLDCGKITYLIKYTFTPQFSIQYYTRQLHDNNLLNMESKNRFLLPFYQQKKAKYGPKSQSMTKHYIFRATNLHQSREFYTDAVGDVGDI